jgi:ribonuclease P/MRP protein subunit RPP40
LQQALDNLCAWADTWQMQFNVKKCKVLHLGHNNRQMDYFMNGQKLEKTTEEVDVGVTISRTCKPSSQCAKAAKTAQAVLGQLARAFHYRDRHIFIRLYIQYVRPHLEYAAVAWSPWLEADKECLEKVQRRAVAMVTGLTGRTYEERLEELGLVTLTERRHQLDMLQVYKILHGIDNVETNTWFEKVTSNGRATRAADDPLNLRIPAPRLDIRRNFFSQRTPKEWNNVPMAVKNAPSKMSFKNGYKKFRRQRTTGDGTQ